MKEITGTLILLALTLICLWIGYWVYVGVTETVPHGDDNHCISLDC